MLEHVAGSAASSITKPCSVGDANSNSAPLGVHEQGGAFGGEVSGHYYVADFHNVTPAP